MFRSWTTVPVTLALTLLVALGLVFAPPAAAQPRQFTLDPDQNLDVEDDEAVEDWNNDILNLTIEDPGVLLVEGRRAGLVGIDGDEDVCGSTRNVGAGWLPATQGRRAIAVRPGVYDLQITPHGTTWIKHKLRFRLHDSCTGTDDHEEGDVCATELCDATPLDGEIETSGDIDSFTFYLASSTAVTVESTGSTDVYGELFDEGGSLIASDDDTGSGVNFQMVETLAAGRYFVRVQGSGSATGEYDVSLD
jgi:hypothetical protein